MTRQSHLISLFLVAILLSSLIFGCIFNDDSDDGGGVKTYDSFGEWPQHEGHWSSIIGAAGDKHSQWAYMDITIDTNGVFSGTYQSYHLDYVYNMETNVGTIPISVYNPGGASKTVNGAIDFENTKGLCTFEGIGESSFEIVFNSNNEIFFIFDPDCLYTHSVIER